MGGNIEEIPSSSNDPGLGSLLAVGPTSCHPVGLKGNTNALSGYPASIQSLSLVR